MTASSLPYGEALGLLDMHRRALNSAALWAESQWDNHRKSRDDLRQALEALTVWHRPKLEAGPGLDAPYEWLRHEGSLLEAYAATAMSARVREEALRYLQLLPFPGQWRRLIDKESSDIDPELVHFFQQERKKLDRKLNEKPDRIFKIRHFIQVLKRPKKDREKGVLRVFSLPYLFLARGLTEELSRRYVFFVEPPMGIVWRHAWWRRFCALEDPCLFGVAGAEDARFLSTQHHAVPIRLAHGDFLEDLDKPPPVVPKDFDLVFNATFDDMERKRHELMLDMLTHPALSIKTALFLGRGSPTSISAFSRAVQKRHLEHRVTLMANVRRSLIPELLARCRLGVHLSLYENACRAVMEYFRSDIPCVVSSSMAGMRLEMFTEETGAAVPDADLPETIAEALDNLPRYAPRRWFLRESGSLISSRRLNRALQIFFHERGMPWTEDIVPLTSSGASRYGSPQDEARFKEDHAWIAEQLQNALPPGFQIVP